VIKPPSGLNCAEGLFGEILTCADEVKDTKAINKRRTEACFIII
jgi:chromosome condensin MukBEF MukE localization factor